MTQSVAVLTGCAAGATESFLVTPFELVSLGAPRLVPTRH